ncbi:MAG: TonB-dependent receptor [Bacteroidota bacterium]
MRKILTGLILLLFTTSIALAQRNVTGTVVGDGEPLIGATVLVDGTTVGTVTDFEGKYSISVPDDSNILVFSYTGYETKKMELGASNVLDVTMSTDNLILDEVVVTAYGSQTKRQITGSVVSVKGEDIENIQNSHVVQGLTGKIAGVQIIAQSGQPGDAPSVRFRGIGSVNASNQPLYVVDGVPFNGNINSIASQDIESMTFLKDASANALYGSRGANGVIIITTKKGKTKGLEVTLDARVGINTRNVEDYDVIRDPGEYYETWFDRWRIGLMNTQGLSSAEASEIVAAGIVSGGDFSLGYNNYNVADDQVIDPATGQISPGASLLYQDDWDSELFSTSVRTETHLGIRHKSDKVGTFFSLGYLDDEGYALQSGFERITGRAALDFDATDWLKVGGNVNYANTTQNSPIQNVGSATYSNLFSWARNVAPIYPIYGKDANGADILDANGDRVFDFGELDDNIPGVRPYGAFNNPVATSLLDLDNNTLDNLSGRMYATVEFLDDFSFTYNFSTDFVGGNITTFATPIGGDAKGVNGRLTTTSTRRNTIAHQQLLNWGKTFGSHNISVLLGHESNQFDFSLVRAQKTEALLGDLPVLNNATNIQYAEGYEKEYTVEGYFSRVNYDFDGKYFLNASFRRDGSSVFHPDNRWGNFFGVGAAWDITREAFLQDISWLSSLRLKASFGQQGNDAILYETNQTITGDNDNRNYFAYVDQFNVVNAGGGLPGVSFLALGNPDLVWETSTNVNFGFDASLIRNRLSLEVEYFVRQVDDLLFYRPLPLSEGRGSFPDNVGDMENRGIEVTVNAAVISKPDFSWNLSFNATHFKNEITRLPQEFIDDPTFAFMRLEEGRSRYDYFTREFAGVDAETGDALWFMDEMDADGNPTGNRITTNEYNNATEYFLDKSAIPDLYGGFSTGLSYKSITLDINFAYQLGGYAYDGIYQSLLGASPDIGNNYHKDIQNSWTPENTNASIPRLDLFDTENDNTSDFWLVDASYLSLQDIIIGYELPSSLFDNVGISGLKVYAAASNVYLWSSRQGFDPRLSVVGRTTNEYSIIRSMSIGANVRF